MCHQHEASKVLCATSTKQDPEKNKQEKPRIDDNPPRSDKERIDDEVLLPQKHDYEGLYIPGIESEKGDIVFPIGTSSDAGDVILPPQPKGNPDGSLMPPDDDLSGINPDQIERMKTLGVYGLKTKKK